jgi:hypothetical protein
MGIVTRGTATACLCVCVVAAAGCGSTSAATMATTPVQSTLSTSGDIGAARAIAIAEASGGNPRVSRPSDAQAMSFQAALDAIGSSPDYSHAPTAPVWLVHVYGAFADRRSLPAPRDLGATTTSAPPATSTTVVLTSWNYFVIIDAITAQVIVENY